MRPGAFWEWSTPDAVCSEAAGAWRGHVRTASPLPRPARLCRWTQQVAVSGLGTLVTAVPWAWHRGGVCPEPRPHSPCAHLLTPTRARMVLAQERARDPTRAQSTPVTSGARPGRVPHLCSRLPPTWELRPEELGPVGQAREAAASWWPRAARLPPPQQPSGAVPTRSRPGGGRPASEPGLSARPAWASCSLGREVKASCGVG